MKNLKKNSESKNSFVLLFFISCFTLVTLLIQADKPKTEQTFTSEMPDEDERESSLCGGVERWAVKIFTDPLAGMIDFTPHITTIAHLVSLSVPVSWFYMPRQAIEDSTFTVDCNITIKKVEGDNDYHLVLSDGTHTLIGEVPDPTCASVAVSPKVNEFISVRNWVNAHIASGNVNNVNIAPVTVTGVAYLDTMHGQTGAAPNQLELHSIIDIHFVSVNGYNELSKNNIEVEVFPNPFNNITTFHISSVKNNLSSCILKLFNVTGNEIKEIPVPVIDGKVNYSLYKNNFKPGIYFYKMENEGFPISNGKLIVE